MFTRISAITGYIALMALFLAATIHSAPGTPTLSMTSMSIEKTNRLTVGSPDSFVTERFAG